MTSPFYTLGHSARELERLNAQARMIGPVTRRYFRAAGIGPGMRVLDVGSGAGDTAILAAELVGESGQVIGSDRVPAAIVAATARVKADGIRNVSFREGDPAELTFERPFDAVVGRYVLLFQVDPATMLRKLAAKLRPGGVMVFHEPEWDNAQSIPPAPTYDRCRQWIEEVLRRAGTPDRKLVARLHQAFIEAGLPAPSMRLETFVGGGEECQEWLQAVAELVGSLVPAMEKFGVATAAEVGMETLTERLRREVVANGSVIFGRSEIGVWANV